MNKTLERLKIVDMPGGGQQVQDADPKEGSETTKAQRTMDVPCVRCRKPIGREVFVIVNGVIHPNGHYHKRCVSI